MFSKLICWSFRGATVSVQRGSKPPKGSKSRDSPQTSHATVYPIKTWVFAILPLIEFLAKMAYGRGVKN